MLLQINATKYYLTITNLLTPLGLQKISVHKVNTIPNITNYWKVSQSMDIKITVILSTANWLLSLDICCVGDNIFIIAIGSLCYPIVDGIPTSINGCHHSVWCIILKDLVSWGSPGECSMIDHFFLERCFWCFVLPILEYCSALWCSAANTHLTYWTV